MEVLLPNDFSPLSVFCVRCPKAAEVVASRETFSTGQWTWRAQMRVLGHLFTFLVSPESVLWQRFFFSPRGLQSIMYTYLWSEKFSMATENFKMPFFYFIPKVQKVCLYSSPSLHIIGYDLIFIALDIFIHIITYNCLLKYFSNYESLREKFSKEHLEETD